MINNTFKYYDFFTFGDLDSYGQPQLSKEPKGRVKMAVFTTSQNVQDNVLYTNAGYMALTYDKNISDKCVIDYNGTKLKVLYVSGSGRLRQAYLSKMG